MAEKFELGNRIKPSAVGLKTFRSWRGRQGTIVGRSRKGNVWEVRWDGRPKIESIHEDFITLSDDCGHKSTSEARGPADKTQRLR
jgi:hypothetical protein